MFIFVPCLLVTSPLHSPCTYYFYTEGLPCVNTNIKNLLQFYHVFLSHPGYLIPGDQGDLKICHLLSTFCVIGTWLRYLLGAYSLLGTVRTLLGVKAISISEIHLIFLLPWMLYIIVTIAYTLNVRSRFF